MSSYDTDHSYRTKLRSVVPITSDELADIARMMDIVSASRNAKADPVKMYDSNGEVLGTVGWDNDMGEVVFTPGG